MDFGLSEEQEMLQETLRGFAEKECPTTRVRELFDAGQGHDPVLWSGLAEMGIAGLAVPEQHGGAGLDLLDVALAAAGCDLVFAPDVAELYPVPQTFTVQPPDSLANDLCGAFRPGHFAGVATVVLKLFNLVRPDAAVFGIPLHRC